MEKKRKMIEKITRKENEMSKNYVVKKDIPPFLKKGNILRPHGFSDGFIRNGFIVPANLITNADFFEVMRFEPEDESGYWTVNGIFQAEYLRWKGSCNDVSRYYAHNVFETYAECKAMCKKLCAIMKKGL